MIQPFWALPLLSLTGVKLQEMMSYTVIIFIGSGVVTGLFLLLN
jgi:short-chain fatty acids transporter